MAELADTVNDQGDSPAHDRPPLSQRPLLVLDVVSRSSLLAARGKEKRSSLDFPPWSVPVPGSTISCHSFDTAQYSETYSDKAACCKTVVTVPTQARRKKNARLPATAPTSVAAAAVVVLVLAVCCRAPVGEDSTSHTWAPAL
ncbi:hypothetical protein CDD80_2501 [Ophiocordyceps camponoti-rufipedis]|uniref:Uncharacterized protein n=1 Tax=Ophiocordyceps camponoti-rufipedis TaxID=2004952 RepID=A0A2C5Z7C6_9HYPO|nr:hypothetical protein CDD80_2501 [Ophiocordyceps camponoti-rufipedis]